MASSATVKLPAPVIEDGLGRRFWIKFRKEWTQAMYTPFVVCLAAGNLKLDTFRHYISQDVHFLRAFAKAYEMAEEFADDDDAKVGICELRKSVLEELNMHDSFVQEWGFESLKESTSNAATVKYTDFLLATASGKVEGVKAPALQTEDLLDKLSVSLTGEELDIIEKLFNQAMKLEVEFFLAQPLAQKTVVPLCKEHNPAEHCLMLFSDFDLTCTVVDSSAILAEIAIITAPKSDQVQSGNQLARMFSVDLRSTWGELSKQYTEEYEQCVESILLSDEDFEKRANLRVIDSGVLKGLNADDIKRAGERLILQDGCTNFFLSLAKNENLNTNIHFLSYCWCGDLIRSAFSSGDLQLLLRKVSRAFYLVIDFLNLGLSISIGGLGPVNVHANEFIYDNSLSTGEIVKKVESPIDKVQAFTNILQNSCKDRKILTVYIGDSVGDLLCLLEADVGIVIGSSSSLRRVGSHFGVSFVPLFPGLIEKQKQFTEDSSSGWKGLSGVLYTVSSWAEIHAFILGS
ncbi:hypothetical protein DH2020_010668 [Rehmannia glutinosa]|uniref:Thiaminase-2/PQQC domain-containing protein n=1 Tax=Rehmannia glutinosa TaxID=99300 RepID=A0ABR0XB75_REHGL